VKGFLLDSHIWLWMMSLPEKLSSAVVEAISAPDVALWLSPLSVLELHIQSERDRVTLPLPPGEWIRRAIAVSSVREAPLTADIVLKSRTFSSPPRDPVDRLLIATAAELDLTIVTADRRIARTRECRVLHNRRRRT